ncbi:MAG: ATP-binding protein [Dysgonamonadaceae bacterium]|jgi:hypothetical protein|nr:ATP-binding protein [Dysgonamonadaceae bacterium]
MALQRLPVGIQSFEKLRSGDFLYVDKTGDIFRMVSLGNPCSLSRPRRFGKSLLISTLDCLFSGKKELFEGLYIYDKWDWAETNPVIRFDFGSQNYQNAKRLEEDLIDKVNEYAAKYEIELTRTWAARFAELIEKIHEKTGKTVVVLVDEYDKAIIDHLNDAKLAAEIRVALHNFYQVLKATDDHLRFIFLTGVSKFTRVSIFSGLNNLKDLTILPNFSTICGITQQELETHFALYIIDMANSEDCSQEKVLERIKYWYNGFSWDGLNFVYNPFSTLQLFQEKEFRDYWFESGSPTFLIDMIKQRNDIETVLEQVTIPAGALDTFDIENINTATLLFQTGYLTVKSKRTAFFGSEPTFFLEIPNNEVRSGLLRHLVAAYANSNITDVAIATHKMMEQLATGNSVAFNQSLQRLMSRIPYQLHIKHEHYYHSLFLSWLYLLGFTPEAEISTNVGRIDAVWTWNERVVIAECKYSSTESAEKLIEEAFAQIHEKKYYEHYAGENRRIALLAVVFTGKEVESRMVEME